MKLGIENLNFAVCLDVTGAYLPLAHGLNIDGLGTLAVQLRDDALDVQYDLGNIFLDAGDGGKLMLDTCDLDGSSRGAGQRRKQNSSQAIAEVSESVPVSPSFSASSGMVDCIKMVDFSGSSPHAR